METHLLEVQRNLVEVPDQFQKCKKQNENLRKKISYWKSRTLKFENQYSKKHMREKLFFKIKELKQVIKYRENKKFIKRKDFENKKLNLFQNGKYSNQVRATYQDVISGGGVSASKIEKALTLFGPKLQGFKL